MYLKSNTHVVERPSTMQYMRNIGKTIEAARTAKGWSQEELAKRAGISQGTIGHLESGRNTSSRKLPEIAKALGMTVEELLAGSAPSTPPIQEITAKAVAWPFRIEIERVVTLPPEKRAEIEGFIRGIVQSWESEHAKRKAG